jgi:hypothetical protein
MTRLQPKKVLIVCAKTLLQQYLPAADSSSAAKLMQRSKKAVEPSLPAP